MKKLLIPILLLFSMNNYSLEWQQFMNKGVDELSCFNKDRSASISFEQSKSVTGFPSYLVYYNTKNEKIGFSEEMLIESPRDGVLEFSGLAIRLKRRVRSKSTMKIIFSNGKAKARVDFLVGNYRTGPVLEIKEEMVCEI